MRGRRQGFQRSDRLNSALIKELTLLLQRKVKDPRCADVVLVEVDVTPDLGHARVFYQLSGFGDFDPEVQKGLEKVAPFLRNEIKKLLSLHSTPQFHFVFDKNFKEGTGVLELLSRIDREGSSLEPETGSPSPKSPEINSNPELKD